MPAKEMFVRQPMNETTCATLPDAHALGVD